MIKSGMNVVLGGMVLMLALSACGSVPGTPEAPETPMGLPSGLEADVKEALSTETGIPVEAIEIVEAEQVEWPDACLGLAGEDEACAQVITPGWNVTLEAEGETYVLRTDRNGDMIRMEQ